MTSTTNELLGLPARLGRFELRRLLGRGGMGRVVLGHDPLLKRDVALKLVEPTAVEPDDLPELRYMFHREARATAALRHPNIVEIFDYSGPDAELVYIACELIDGPTLREVLDAHGRLATTVLAALGYELAQALAHAHAHGIIHRDIKPENIFWTAPGRVVVGDFGIAKAFDGSPRLGGTVQFGATSLYGSPAYMAPEQLTGAEVGPKADLFALGSLLFECFTGVSAFDGPDVESILEAVKQGRREPIPAGLSTPGRLRALFDRLLAPAPAARLPSALAISEELRELLDELGIGDPRRALRLENGHPSAPTAHEGGGDWVKKAAEPAEPSAWPDRHQAGSDGNDAATVIELAAARGRTSQAAAARDGATAIVPIRTGGAGTAAATATGARTSRSERNTARSEGSMSRTTPDPSSGAEAKSAGSRGARRMTLVIAVPASALAIVALGFLAIRLLGSIDRANPPMDSTIAPPTVAISQPTPEGAPGSATGAGAGSAAAVGGRAAPVAVPPAAAAEAVGVAPVSVTLTYAGSGEIWIDGVLTFAGRGPAHVSLTPGRHRIELRLGSGGGPLTRDVLIIPGTTPQFEL